jgi:flagellar biosynthesis/type III secretory pathway protein FliH
MPVMTPGRRQHQRLGFWVLVLTVIVASSVLIGSTTASTASMALTNDKENNNDIAESYEQRPRARFERSRVSGIFASARDMAGLGKGCCKVKFKGIPKVDLAAEARKLAEQAKKLEEEAKKKLEEETKKLAEEAKKLAEEAKRKLEEEAKKLAEAALSAATKAYDESVGALNSVKNAVDGTINDINTLVNELTSGIPTKANEITSTITDSLKQVTTVVGVLVQSLIDEAFSADADKVMQQISSTFSAASLGSARVSKTKSYDHFARVLHEDRVRERLRKALRGEKYESLSQHSDDVDFSIEKNSAATPSVDIAHLGSSCAAPKLELSLPLENYLKEDAIDLSYDMPWPNKLGASPFAPATLKAGFPDPSWSIGFEVRDFGFPKQVATDILSAFRAFFEPLFNSIKDGVADLTNDAQKQILTPAQSLTSAVNTAKDTAVGVKNALNSVKNALNGRKLLSDDDALEHAEHLQRLHTSVSAQMDLVQLQHESFLNDVEDHVVLYVAKIRTALAEDPWLERPDTMAQFPHLHASLGGPLQDGADSAKTKLIRAMAGLQDFTMTSVLYMRMHLEFKVEAEAEAFKAGDVLDLATGVPKSAEFEAEFPIPYTPFTMKSKFAATISMPYFLQAKASGTFGYSADLEGMEIGFTVSNGQINAVLPEPVISLTPELNANLEAHAQVGLVTEVTEMTTLLCLSGMVCSGPTTTAEQRLYIGADMAAQAVVGSAAGCGSLNAEFNDNFQYTVDYIESKCRTASFGGVNFAIGYGAYVQIPKTELSVVLKTEVDIQGVQICVDDVPLYSWPPENASPNFLLKTL